MKLTRLEKRAQRNLNKLWKLVAPKLPGTDHLDTPRKNNPPKLIARTGEDIQGYAWIPGFTNSEGGWMPIREIHGSPHYIENLAKMNKPLQRSGARFTTLHELGHMYGDESEGAANRTANKLSIYLNKRLASGEKRKTKRKRLR